MPRGYAAIGLYHPKDKANVGGALRAAYVYGAQLVAIEGVRNDALRHASNTAQAWRHIPTITTDNLHSTIPFDCIPIAVELVDGATPLPKFWHPQRAFYIFGPEDGSLGKSTLDYCKHKVMVPGNMCMNLAATVNVVLYSRLAQSMNNQHQQAAE